MRRTFAAPAMLAVLLILPTATATSFAGFESGEASFPYLQIQDTSGAATLTVDATAARSGGAGAIIDVTNVFTEGWQARVMLADDLVVPSGATGVVATLWLRGSSGFAPPIDFIDQTASYAWRGHWQGCVLEDDVWTVCSRQSDSLSGLEGHLIDVGLSVGAFVGMAFLDDITIEWLVASPATPPASLTTPAAAPPPPVPPSPPDVAALAPNCSCVSCLSPSAFSTCASDGYGVSRLLFFEAALTTVVGVEDGHDGACHVTERASLSLPR